MREHVAKNAKKRMINVKEVVKLLECSILTSFVKNKERGINILILADAESGKSQMIELLKNYPYTFYTNDLSYKSFIEEIIPKYEHYEISYLLIPDFINPISHKRGAETLIPALNSVLAEGVKDLKFYGSSKTFSREVKGNLITGITKEIFDKKILTWRDNGFLSRVVPLSFSYSQITKMKIHDSIIKDDYLVTDKIEKDFSAFKLNSFTVTIPKLIGDKISILMEGLVSQNKSYAVQRYNENKGSSQNYTVNLSKYGFRLHKQLRVLIQGIALYNLKKPNPNLKIVVTEKDFNDLQEAIKFMNFNFTEI